MNEAALRAIARMALERKTGARGLRSIMVCDAQHCYAYKEHLATVMKLLDFEYLHLLLL